MNKKTVALVVLDGFGVSQKTEGNATLMAKMPFYNSLIKEYPHSLIRASGKFVGLKNGQMGNSETGHLNIGAGRIVKQDLTIIDDAIETGDFYKNKTLLELLNKTKQKDSALHILGLMSNGGVHSHINHLYACLKMAKMQEIKEVYIHCFTDGRDTSPTSAVNFLKDIEKQTRKIGIGKIATIVGRYYAMDREKYYDRTKIAYDLLVNRNQTITDNAAATVKQSYEDGITDEFLKPIMVDNAGIIKKNDSVIFINFRKDRAKQITDALTNKNFTGFKTDFTIKDFLTFTNLGDEFNCKIAFNKTSVTQTLSEVVSKKGMTQAKFAEPTKFPHVTYFLNGGNEKPFTREDWYKIPAKNVKTFDEAPEMSAIELAKTFIKQVIPNRYDFVMCNFANGDMVGHTGNIQATIKACETLDKALKIIVNHIKKIGGEVLICADHGNAEQMIYRNKICTTHSNNPVRVILVSDSYKNCKMKSGALKDIAPTILYLLGIQKPKCYTGNNLLLTN